MMKPNGSGAGIEWTGVGSDDALAQVGDLEPLVFEIFLYEFGHRPVKQQGTRLIVIAKPLLNLLPSWGFIEPHVPVSGGAQGIAEAANDVGHLLPADHIARRKGTHFRSAAFVVIPQLDAGAIEEGHEEAVDGGRPLETAAGKIELSHNLRVKQAAEVGAGGHAD